MNEVAQPTSNRAFPLFINGRPGSGKSTLLYYLFASYLRFYLNHREALSEHPPLFITYSRSLLRNAREKVEELVRFDRPQEGTQQRDALKDALAQEAPHCFKEFRSFLIELLPEAEKAEFEMNDCVRFAEFEDWVIPILSRHGNAEIRNLSPEICWHVIRTYIKGMQQETGDYMTAEMYEEISPRHRTVSLDTFRLIEQHIWPAYKQHLSEKQLWDDQDLARKVLDLVESGQLSLSRYTAIICDESQDFTTIELELISLLSLYLKRDLSTYRELHRIPIGFAGDPFQTLNPTGFNWDATKRLFYNLVVRLCDSANANGLDINYKELRYNYRSTRHIVQFCNFIQLLRGITFQIPNLLPQTTWQREAARIPVFFNIDTPIAQDGLQKNKKALIIIPCDEGKESEYIQNDPFLAQIAWDHEKQTSTRDILSPMTAKGLEFDRVILYKFGDYAHQQLKSSLPRVGKSIEEENKEQLLPLEYFFNQLYVAASRAQKKIIIVDTKEGLNSLWHLFKSAEKHDKLLDMYNPEVAASLGEKWGKEDICILIQGTTHDWEEQFDEDLLRRADQFFREGKEREDKGAIQLLERARDIYEMLNEHTKAKKAQIEIYKKQGKFKEAAALYQEIGAYRDALKYFWKALSYENIVALAQTEESIKPMLEYQASAFLQRPGPHTPDIFVRLYQSREINNSFANYGREWKQTFTRLLNAIDSYEIKEACRDDLSHALDYFKQRRYLAPSQQLAKLMYYCHLAPQMVKEVLEGAGIMAGTASTELEEWIHETFAQTLPWPQSVVHLSVLGQYSKIIELSAQNPNQTLTPNQWPYLLEAYYQQKGRHWDKVPEGIRDKYILYLLFEKNLDEAKKETATEALLQHYLHTQQWRQALRWIGRQEVEYLQPRSRHPLPIAQQQFLEQLIRYIAQSRDVQNMPHDELNVLTRFLEEIFHALDPEFRLRGDEWNRFFDKKTQLKRLAQKLDPKVLGAAFESIGRHANTLRYYKWLLRTNKKQRPYARKRWAKNALKLIEFYQSQGRHEQSTELYHKLQQQLDRWGMSMKEVEKEPDYPDLVQKPPTTPPPTHKPQPEPTPTTTPQAPPPSRIPSTVTFRIEQKALSGELLYHQQRWRLKDAYDNELIYHNGQLTSYGEVSIHAAPTEKGEKRWEIPLWQIAILLQVLDNQHAFLLTDLETGSVCFQFAL